MSVIEFSQVKKYYGKTKAVDDITFTVEKGEVFGFLGPNGAGKTTTIRCMMDFIRPTSGHISLLGKDAQQASVELKKKLGFLSGYVHLHDKWTGKEHISFFHSLRGGVDVSQKLIERLDFNPNVKTKQLSSGNRQKLGIILALMSEPELIIMDEPTNGLDPLLQNEVYGLLKEATERGATIFMSSHNLSEIDRVCSRVGIIREGKMVASERIQDLKQKRLYTVHIATADSLDTTQLRVEGVTSVDLVDHGAVVKIKGDVNPIVKKLSALKLHDIAIEHASLDEIFLEFYQR